VADTPFGVIESPSVATMAGIRACVEKQLPAMHHCTRCRADAVGLLGQPAAPELVTILQEAAQLPLDPQADRPYVAVASLEGVLVNQHLGEAAA
jgi:nitrogen fixation protein NifB